MYYLLIPFIVLIVLTILLMCVNISINIVCCNNADSDSNKSSRSKNNKNNGFRIFIRYAFFTFYLFPPSAEKKDKKKKPKVGKKVTEVEKTVAKVKEDLLTGEIKISEAIDIIKQISEILVKNFKKYLKLKIKKFVVTVATDDAQKTALTYGKATQTVYYLYEFLNVHFNISFDEIKIYSDFENDKTLFDINMKFSIKVWHALKTILLTVIKYQDFDKNN